MINLYDYVNILKSFPMKLFKLINGKELRAIVNYGKNISETRRKSHSSFSRPIYSKALSVSFIIKKLLEACVQESKSIQQHP